MRNNGGAAPSFAARDGVAEGNHQESGRASTLLTAIVSSCGRCGSRPCAGPRHPAQD